MTMPSVIDLAAYRRQREPEKRVHVLKRVDPGRPQRTEYWLKGLRCGEVQQYIDSLIAEVEMHGVGFGRFFGPHREGDGYVAHGEIILVREDIL